MAKTPRSIKKPLLISATAFLTFYPLCLAQAATSSFAKQPLQPQTQIMLGMLKHSLPKTNPSLLLRSFSPLSLDTLKSTLANYKEQLRLLSLKVSNQERLQPLETAISKLEAQIQAIITLQSAYATAQSTLTKLTASYDTAQQNLNQAILTQSQLKTTNEEATALYNQANTALNEATTALNNAQAAATQAADNLAQATTKLNEANATLASKLTALNQAQKSSATATEELSKATSEYNIARDNYFLKTGNKSAAVQTFNEAVQRLEAAQANYNKSTISDPTYIPPTYQQEHTREVTNTRTVPVTTLVPNKTYITKGGVKAEIYDRQGYNNAPPLPNDSERPVYTTTVSNINFQWGGGDILNSGYSEDVIVKFTGNLLFPEDGKYRFHTPADDGTKLNIAGMDLINDWRDKGGGGSTSQEVFIRGGVLYPFTLYYYENGGGANVWFYYYTSKLNYQLVPENYLGNTIEEVTTYTEVTTNITETYYTYETYYTTELVPNQTAPLINDPSLLPAVEQALEAKQSAEASLQEATQEEASSSSAFNEASSKVATYNQNLTTYNTLVSEAQVTYDLALAARDQALTEFNSASSDYQTAANNKTSAMEKNSAETSKLLMATSNLQTAAQNLTTADERLKEATATFATSEIYLTTATDTAKSLATDLNNTASDADTSSALAKTLFSEIQPDPIPEPEQGSAEIPAVIENLMDINLSKVDPTELSETQAVQLVEAALVVFETATEGSAEYEQALDALILAAQQDDIQVDPTLEAIPGVGEAAKAVVAIFNLVSNVGADISPKKRKEAQSLVVTTLVVGQIAQAAALASASSGSSTRRK